MPNLQKHFKSTCQALFCCHDQADLNFTFMQNYVLVYLQSCFDLAHKSAGSRPCDLSSALISSCSYLQTSAKRMKGERDHLNQQQLITEQIHIFLIFCGIQSLQKTNFPQSKSSTNSKKQHALYRLKIRVEVKVKKLPYF